MHRAGRDCQWRVLHGGMIEDTETIDEFLARHASDVEEAVRKAAAAEIMPRFRQLAAHEVDEKSGPHDLVTDADRQAPSCTSPTR